VIERIALRSNIGLYVALRWDTFGFDCLRNARLEVISMSWYQRVNEESGSF